MSKTPDSGSPAGIWDQPNEVILDEFVRRTTHDSGRTAAIRRSQITAQLERFEAATGETVALLSAVTDRELLGPIMACDRRLDGKGRLSRSAVVGTRVAFRALVSTLPPPEGFTRDELRRIHAGAGRWGTEQRGLRRVLTVGEPPRQDPRPVPTAADLALVIDDLRATGDSVDVMVADVCALAYLNGLRIDALLTLTRDDLSYPPDGTVVAYVYEKARHDRRAVLLQADRPALLREWRVLPAGTSLWGVDGRRLSYDRVTRRLKRACERVDVPVFTFHRNRHAFGTHLGYAIGLESMRRAGGWRAASNAEGYMHREGER